MQYEIVLWYNALGVGENDPIKGLKSGKVDCNTSIALVL